MQSTHQRTHPFSRLAESFGVTDIFRVDYISDIVEGIALREAYHDGEHGRYLTYDVYIGVGNWLITTRNVCQKKTCCTQLRVTDNDGCHFYVITGWNEAFCHHRVRQCRIRALARALVHVPVIRCLGSHAHKGSKNPPLGNKVGRVGHVRISAASGTIAPSPDF